MLAPALPSDEDERLAALRALELLDTPTEERFDRITRIAQRLFDVPIVLVSLVDQCRQWFKSTQGLSASETPRDISFCGHAIHADQVFVVENTLADPRFADNPLVTGPPDIRFYAGAPLVTSGGFRVGTLCLIDTKPHVFPAADQQVLRDLASWVEDELGRRHNERFRKIGSEQEAFLRAILNTVVDGIITIDERGNVESFNPAAVRLFGYPPEEVIGHNIKQLMPEPYRSEHDGYLAHFLHTRSPRVIGIGREVTGCRKDGSTFPMELAVSETVVDGRRFFTGIVRDISERKKVDRLKTEFVSTVSHELRTPLTSIRGSLGLIAGGIAGELPPQAAQLIDIAHSNSERLVRLINDILDVEKIESGRMQFNFSVLPLRPLLLQAIEANRAYAAQLQVDIELVSGDRDGRVRIDSDRMMQAITNLLSNASKYSPPHGCVEVALEKRGAWLRLSVSDRGPGMTEEFQARIFQKFSQADSSDTRRKGGTGLGLVITKSMVESMAGNIGFDTSPAGTTFWIDLPETPELDLVASQGADESGKPRVLICEDDPVIAGQLRESLEDGGYRADIAHNAAQAKALLSTRRYAALTLNIALPGNNGTALISELREDPRARELPIIVVSALARAEQEALLSGITVADWLEKPIDPSRLLAAVRDSVREENGSHRPRILHVDDDADILSVVAAIAGHIADFDQATDLHSASQLLATRQYDLIILDLALPDGSGSELLPLIAALRPEPRVLVFSASDVPRAEAECFAACLVKSVTANEDLLDMIKTQIGQRAPQEKNT